MQLRFDGRIGHDDKVSRLEVEATRRPPSGLQKPVEQVRWHRVGAEVACGAPRANEVDERLELRARLPGYRLVTFAHPALLAHHLLPNLDSLTCGSTNTELQCQPT